MAESSSVQSLERAFDLLEKLCRSRNGMTIGTLSAETGLHKSTVHRLLATMCTVSYTHLDVYKRQVEVMSSILTVSTRSRTFSFRKSAAFLFSEAGPLQGAMCCPARRGKGIFPFFM